MRAIAGTDDIIFWFIDFYFYFYMDVLSHLPICAGLVVGYGVQVGYMNLSWRLQ